MQVLSLPKTPSIGFAIASESEHDCRMIGIAFLFVRIWLTLLPRKACDWLFLFLRVRNLFLHPSVVIAGPTPGGSPDVVLYPDVDPFIADRLRGVLRY